MSADESQEPAAGEHTTLHDLVAEASRQLTICNSCRYCEGLCAVFPALERRTIFETGDVSQLANLCHDCRACFDSCMYTPPHPFAVNLPRVLSTVRLADYRRYVWPRRVPAFLSGLRSVGLAAVAAGLAFLVAALGHAGGSGLVRARSEAASPYDVIPYPVILVLVIVPAAFAVAVMTAGAVTFWRATATPGVRFRTAALVRAIGYSANLRYLRGGGGECFYPDDRAPSGIRRHLHGAVGYGFGLCLVSTISAGILQDILGEDPPYGWLSVPLITGIVGGVGLVVGSLGLIVLKRRPSPRTTEPAMGGKDLSFLCALLALGVTGIVTLLTRTTAAYGPVLLVHLATVGATFVIAPYSKIAHVPYRFLALVRDNMELAHDEKGVLGSRVG